ncbi:hypothetical protein [Adhaeribacter arboris]|nr:hypothetical protein [Adhaeribacter arboris]
MRLKEREITLISGLLLTLLLIQFYPAIKNATRKKQLKIVLICLLLLAITFLIKILREFARVDYEVIIVEGLVLGILILLILAGLILIYGLIKLYT